MLEHITSIINHINIGYLILIIWYFFQQLGKVKNGHFALLLAIGHLIHIIGYNYFATPSPLGYFFSFIIYSTVFVFYFFSKSIFEEKVVFGTKETILYILYITICMFGHYFRFDYLQGIETNNGFFLIIKIIPQVLILIVTSLVVTNALTGIKTDLINERIRFRKIFALLVSIITIVITIAVIGLDLSEIKQEFHFIFNLLTILPVIYLLHQKLDFSKGFFFEKETVVKEKKEKKIDEDSKRILKELDTLMIEKQYYHTENLSISHLAEKINCKEYKLRLVINSQLGFKNFNDYLNQYRIEEAKNILSNQKKNNLTILEIAFSLGYNSISPFNRAFKANTGKTPTQYRADKQK